MAGCLALERLVLPHDLRQHVRKSVLQLVLRRIVIEGSADFMSIAAEDASQQTIENPDNLKAATIIFSTLPILMFYPFLQRYFVKGVVVGALKG